MQRAGERFNDDRFFDRHVFRNLVNDGFFGVDHVLGHRTVDVVLKAVEIVL
jgi:hypothetical protein